MAKNNTVVDDVERYVQLEDSQVEDGLSTDSMVDFQQDGGCWAVYAVSKKFARRWDFCRGKGAINRMDTAACPLSRLMKGVIGVLMLIRALAGD